MSKTGSEPGLSEQTSIIDFHRAFAVAADSYIQLFWSSFPHMKMALAIDYDPSKSDEFILDALPYIDDAEYDEKHREFAMKMIEEEQRVYPMTKNYLKAFSKPDYEKFLTSRLKEEFERMSQKKVSVWTRSLYIC